MTAACTHPWEWTVVNQRQADGSRQLQESCPRCREVLATKPVPPLEATAVVDLDEVR